jgi:hypothetical protein
MVEPKCQVCKTNYERIKCGSCGKGVCLHCAKAVSDSLVKCVECVEASNQQFRPTLQNLDSRDH